MIYFDNSATTKPSQGVVAIMERVLKEDFGNPSSMHMKGMEAENYIKDAAGKLAKILHCKEKELIFTSGGTESNNMAIIGTAFAKKRRGKHIITSAMEHASVYEPMRFLEEEGFEVTYLPGNEKEVVDLEALKAALRPDTILVSIMQVNNETGRLSRVEEIGKILHEYNPEIVYHVDAIQSFGKYQINPKKQGIDLLSVSGHKIHGPKGSGFLYCREKLTIKPLILGGGQQAGMRSGTENVPAIAGMGEAAKEIYDHFEEVQGHLYDLKNTMISELLKLPDVTVNSFCGQDSAPHIVSASFKGVRSEVLLHALEGKGVYVSSGSACSSNHPAISKTLQTIHVPEELLDSTIRFSFCEENTEEEIETTIEILKELLPMLRKFTRH